MIFELVCAMAGDMVAMEAMKPTKAEQAQIDYANSLCGSQHHTMKQCERAERKLSRVRVHDKWWYYSGCVEWQPNSPQPLSDLNTTPFHNGKPFRPSEPWCGQLICPGNIN